MQQIVSGKQKFAAVAAASDASTRAVWVGQGGGHHVLGSVRLGKAKHQVRLFTSMQK